LCYTRLINTCSKCSTISLSTCYKDVCECNLFKTLGQGWIVLNLILPKQCFTTSYRLCILDNTNNFHKLSILPSPKRLENPTEGFENSPDIGKKQKTALAVGSHRHKHREILSYRYLTLSFFHWHCNFCQHSKKIQPWSKVTVWQSWKLTSSVCLNNSYVPLHRELMFSFVMTWSPQFKSLPFREMLRENNPDTH
jgi:hypothetical protein